MMQWMSLIYLWGETGVTTTVLPYLSLIYTSAFTDRKDKQNIIEITVHETVYAVSDYFSYKHTHLCLL